MRGIFELYAADWSPRAIADDLNRRGIPSPGSAWRGRTVRRGAGWLASGVYAMLSNPLYAGTYNWNRHAWLKNPDTGKRKAVKRPASDWVTHDMPELRIVSHELWQRVEMRKQRSTVRGDAVRAGIKASAHHGRGPKYIFSGLLVCGVCGSKLNIAGGQGKWKSYACSSFTNGGAAVCSNAINVRKDIVEGRLLEPIQTELLSPQFVAAVQQRVAKLLAIKPAPDGELRLRNLEKQAGNLTDAIAGGRSLTRLPLRASSRKLRLNWRGCEPKLPVRA